MLWSCSSGVRSGAVASTEIRSSRGSAPAGVDHAAPGRRRPRRGRHRRGRRRRRRPTGRARRPARSSSGAGREPPRAGGPSRLHRVSIGTWPHTQRHEVGLPVAVEREGQVVEAAGDVGLDRGPQRLDGVRGEPVRHRAPPPGVDRRVGRQDQVLPVLGQRGRRPAGVAADLGRADGPAAQEAGDVGVARDDPRAVGQLERRRPVPQVAVQGRRVAVQRRIGGVEGGASTPASRISVATAPACCPRMSAM